MVDFAVGVTGVDGGSSWRQKGMEKMALLGQITVPSYDDPAFMTAATEFTEVRIIFQTF